MTTYSKITFCLPALLLICCVVVGCSEVRAPVSGKVTFPDGSPLAVGEVRGYGDGTHIRANLGEDGSFELYEVKPGDRVPSGKTYEITIVNAEEREVVVVRPGAIPSAPPKITPLVHDKFSNAATSGLKLEVPKSSKPMEYNIEVTKP